MDAEPWREACVGQLSAVLTIVRLSGLGEEGIHSKGEKLVLDSISQSGL